MGDVVLRVERGLGRITLNRPRTLNALTPEMVREIYAVLGEWASDSGVRGVLIDGAGERGLCAGGDIRGIYEHARAGQDGPKTFWREEYLLNHRISEFPKPYVAVMDGIVMGGGVGVSGHGSVRIVTERSIVGMPEVGIGFLPDVGGTYLLSRAPGELGTHAALTAARLTGADAIHMGLADHYVRSERLPKLVEAVADGFEDAVREYAEEPPASQLAEERRWIDPCYSADSVEEIAHRLRTSGEAAGEAAAKELLAKSPLSLKVTLKALRVAKVLDGLGECLDLEYRVACALLAKPDLVEGIRAAIIDKDRNPRWSPDRLEEVDRSSVDRCFAWLGEGELGLAVR
ncbi:enoyl-CoA hydratase/isomerase family protein [Allokutzneria sp. A3M-2-11 16]|uniref:enoyl-CoA hydratase/isomerase family protein n=1 Tax=Allokutzneria sp. A3M-2-11 16 TaxID=2962043 RepID=UPI0020B772EA|nr:enoyl-CoA hydratase/isomerase family protein [Allokutzneria sp. A3M-2-11 16]MCP3803035.1 enoyl-CoA hydratase/isomerase family protein [Allokutzneria sp. A3M-2-11 16]